MGEMKPTPGPWSFYTEPQPNGCPIVGNEKGLMVAMVAHSVLFANQSQAALSDARLIAEAGTVFHNTGLSPVQLVEMVKELQSVTRRLMRSFPTDSDMEEAGWEQCEIDEACNAHDAARAALAKCEGVGNDRA